MLIVTLVEATDDDFARLIAGAPLAYAVPPGGVDEPATLAHIRSIVRGVHAGGSRGAWLALDGPVIAGIFSYKTPPAGGVVEIGYGIAPAYRGRGFATAALTEMIRLARGDRDVDTLVALTSPDNHASKRVLQKNGFADEGRALDPEDGAEVDRWRLEVRAPNIALG